jgi:hypothetical protein
MPRERQRPTPATARTDIPAGWTRQQVAALWISVILLVGFFVCIGASAIVGPGQSERFISAGLLSISASFAAFAFAFLAHQTAKLEIKWFGNTASIGGAVAAFVISFGVLQFFVRGTSNLYVELFNDDAFKQPWRVVRGQSVPEFSASLRSYSIITVPEGNNLRLLNIPIFETVSLSVRDPRWQISRIVSEDRTCKVDGQRLSGWCTEARAAVQYVNCIEDWNGSGSLQSGKLDDLLKHFVKALQDVRYPARLKTSLGEQTRRALDASVGTVSYNGQDFCTAINGVKNDLERSLLTRLQIKISCTSIGIAAGSDEFPEADDEKGWRKAC